MKLSQTQAVDHTLPGTAMAGRNGKSCQLDMRQQKGGRARSRPVLPFSCC